VSPSTKPDAPLPNVTLIIPAFATEVSAKSEKAHTDMNLFFNDLFISKVLFSYD
jgi:hypothetical protein